MRTHAILAPSAASRWLTCSKSARLEEKLADTQSDYADEGTLAHSLAELLILDKLSKIKQDEFYWKLAEVESNEYYNTDMLEYCSDYADFIMERYNEALSHTKDAKILTEIEIDLSHYIPESWGHLDVGIISDNMVDIIDLKYGKGVPVDAADNKQMMVYALGFILKYEDFYSMKTVRMTIYQPRIDNITVYEISVAELKKWAKSVLVPRAKLAFEGGDNFVVGDHCRFCKFRVRCKAHADYNLQLAQHEFAEPFELTDQDIADILKQSGMFKNWIAALEGYALDQAVKHGKKWPGFKLVQGRSNRKYTDEEKIEKSLLKAKVPLEDIYKPKKLFGIIELTKRIGKAYYAKYVEKFVVKPPGKPCLTTLDDQRPEYSSLQQAQEDFKDD